MEKRNESGSFVKQAAILAAAGLLTRFLGFVYRLPLTDIIGDIGNGIYAAGYNIYMFFLIVSSAGLPAAISKMVSERIAQKQFKNAKKVLYVSLFFAFVLGAICSLLLYFGAGYISEVTKSPKSYMAIVVLSPTVLIVALMACFRGYFQGMNNTVPTALSQIIEQIFNASFSLILAYYLMESAKGTGDELAMGAAGGTAGTGVGALFGLATIFAIYFMAKPDFDRRIRRDKSGIFERESSILKELVMTAFPIIIGTAIFSFSNIIDMLTVNTCLENSKAFSPDQITALYGQLTGKYVTITTLPVSISAALAAAAIPSIAASHKLRDMNAVGRKIASALRVSMLLSIPCAVGLGVLADPILRLLYPRYSEGSLLISVGAVSIVFLALAQIITGVLQAVGRVNIPVIGACFGVLIKIPVNILLISNPDINVVGAVIGTICCYVFASLFDWFMLYRATKAKPDIIGILVKPLAASTVMGVCCYVAYYVVSYITGSNAVSTILAIIIGAISYFVFMVLFGGIKEEDLTGIPFSNKLKRFII